jgi:hypothetical protein
MAIPTNSKQVNRSLLDKTVNSFYVSFFGIPENDANILGRQVTSIERPTVTFNGYDVFQKNKRIRGNSTIYFDDLTISFKDDDESLVTQALYNQVYRQAGRPINSTDELCEDAMFRVNVKVFNSQDKVIEEFTLKDVYVVSVAHSEQIYADAMSNTISVTLAFTDADYRFS